MITPVPSTVRTLYAKLLFTILLKIKIKSHFNKNIKNRKIVA